MKTDTDNLDYKRIMQMVRDQPLERKVAAVIAILAAIGVIFIYLGSEQYGLETVYQYPKEVYPYPQESVAVMTGNQASQINGMIFMGMGGAALGGALFLLGKAVYGEKTDQFERPRNVVTYNDKILILLGAMVIAGISLRYLTGDAVLTTQESQYGYQYYPFSETFLGYRVDHKSVVLALFGLAAGSMGTLYVGAWFAKPLLDKISSQNSTSEA